MISLVIMVVERKENTWKDSLKEKGKKLFKEKFFRYFDDNEKEETRIKKMEAKNDIFD